MLYYCKKCQRLYMQDSIESKSEYYDNEERSEFQGFGKYCKIHKNTRIYIPTYSDEYCDYIRANKPHIDIDEDDFIIEIAGLHCIDFKSLRPSDLLKIRYMFDLT